MSVSVVVPYTHGIKDRDEIWSMIRCKWEKTGYEIVEVDDPIKSPQGYNKSAAITKGILSSSGDIIIMADSDVWVNDLDETINKLSQYDVVVPHDVIWRFDKKTTLGILANRKFIFSRVGGSRQKVVKGGGMVLITRELALEHLPDTRFIGWGAEDWAWFAELSTFGAVWYGNKTMWHLYHERQDTKKWEANKKLANRYKQCCGKKDEMEKLIREKPCFNN